MKDLTTHEYIEWKQYFERFLSTLPVEEAAKQADAAIQARRDRKPTALPEAE